MSSVRRHRNERSCPVRIPIQAGSLSTLLPKAQCSIGFQPVSGSTTARAGTVHGDRIGSSVVGRGSVRAAGERAIPGSDGASPYH